MIEMTTNPATPQHLKTLLESSLAVLRKEEKSVAAVTARTPIRQLGGGMKVPEGILQKQALSDAATALGLLWKVPEVRGMMPKRPLRRA